MAMPFVKPQITRISALLCLLMLSSTQIPGWTAHSSEKDKKGQDKDQTAGDVTALSAGIAPSPALKLEGRAEMHQQFNNPNLEAWQAAQMYRVGADALNKKDLKRAADCFKRSGDGFENSVGEGKFLAEARFAEAQTRRLMKQDDEAANLFRSAVSMFQRYDTKNPYLKAGLDFLKKYDAKSSALKAQRPKLDSIDRDIPLKARLTQFDDGTALSGLKDGDYFNGSKRFLARAAAVDLSDAFVKKAIYQSFVKMTCLETTALGSNYETVNSNYKPIKSGGKPVVIGASDEFWSPVMNLKINGQDVNVNMCLPGMSKYSKNVMLLTDGQHVVAIDPRTHEAWKLVAGKANDGVEFNWWHLNHKKKICKPS